MGGGPAEADPGPEVTSCGLIALLQPSWTDSKASD